MGVNILLTGATGMLGRYILDDLLKHNVYNLNIVSRNLNNPDSRVNTISADLSNPNIVNILPKDINIIIHCAGEKRNPEKFFASNVTATENLVAYANENNISKFIHVSSVGVIGKSALQIIDEQTPCLPQNAYEQTKLEAEEIVQSKCLSESKYIVRPTNVFDKNILKKIQMMGRFRYALKAYENTNLIDVRNVSAAILYLVHNSIQSDTYILSSDDTENFTYKHLIVKLMQQNRFPMAFPKQFVHYFRLLKNGYSNLGDKTYSGRKLLQLGLEYPHKLDSSSLDYYEITR